MGITRIWYCYCRIDFIDTVYSILSFRLTSDISPTHTLKLHMLSIHTHTRLMQPTFHYVIALSTQLVRFLRGTSLSEVVFASKSSLSLYCDSLRPIRYVMDPK